MTSRTIETYRTAELRDLGDEPVYLVVAEMANWGGTELAGQIWRPGDRVMEGDFEHVPPKFYRLLTATRRFESSYSTDRRI